MKETKQDYAIFVDSSADLSPSLLQDGKLQMVAMSYTNGAENCELAGVASDSAMKAFYDGQRRGNLTRTSQVSPQQFIDAFTPPCKPDTHRGLSGFPDHRDQFPFCYRRHRPSGGRSDREQGSRHDC